MLHIIICNIKGASYDILKEKNNNPDTCVLCYILEFATIKRTKFSALQKKTDEF